MAEKENVKKEEPKKEEPKKEEPKKEEPKKEEPKKEEPKNEENKTDETKDDEKVDDTKVDDSKDDKKEQPKKGVPKVIKYKGTESKRWKCLNNVLKRGSKDFAPPMFDTDEDVMNMITDEFRVLVVGAGGLGCEILKNLALSGFKDIEVIDLDTIELSNLNRQFLFRKKDIGKPKAKCAAEFVMKRVPGCQIKWYQTKIQDFDEGFYRKFNCVIAGLDNIEARRWLNAMLCDLVEFDDDGNMDPESIIPFIDGGTEGFLGQSRLFMPMASACFECSVGTITPPKAFQSCTIASIPRRPEHCIAYAHKIQWRRLKWLKTATDYEMEKNENAPDPDGVDLDKDDVEHMSWLYNRSLERAKKFKIEGVTYTLTQQVVKNIIPAIASTNALISAVCVNECFKTLTWAAYGLNNYFMYMGQDGIYSRTFEYKKNEQCPVCGQEPQKYEFDSDQTFEKLYKKILNDDILKLKDPSISTDQDETLYLGGKMAKLYKDNLTKKVKDLFKDNTSLTVTDPVLGASSVKIKVTFKEGALYIDPDAENK